MKALIATLGLALLAGTAKADQVWTYTGNSTSDPDVGILTPTQFIPTPNPCKCALSGSLTLDASNTPIAWSFTEGSYTLNNTDSTLGLSINLLIPPGEPLFSRWFMGIQGANFDLYSEFEGSNFEATDGGPSLYVQGNKGTWTETVTTPEPGTLALLGLGLAALALKPRKKHIDTSVWEPLA